MNVIGACCFRYLKENKRRTIVTIAGVILATGLITAVACLIMSFYDSFVENRKQTFGDSHACFEGVKGEDLKYLEQNQNLESLSLSSPVGFAEFPETKMGRVYLNLRAADADWYRRAGEHLTSGRMPEKENEIIVGRDLRTQLGMDYKVGDQIVLGIGPRVAGDQVLTLSDDYQEGECIRVDAEKTYTIVGFLRGGYLPMWSDGQMLVGTLSAYTYLDFTGGQGGRLYDVRARYTKWGLRHYDQVNAGLSDIAGDVCVDHELIGLERLDLRDKDVQSIVALLLVVFLLIVLAGIFGIINSFDVSLTEKIRFYGMLASVGTTRRQRRQLVWLEALCIGGAGIAGGLVFGVFFAYGLVRFVNATLSRRIGYGLLFGISWPAILAAVFFSALMVFLSAVESADRAAKISPIEAIRSNTFVKDPGKSKKTPGYVKKVFGMGGYVAYQNFQRAKVKYRIIVITIAVSVSGFVGMSTLRYALDAVEKDMKKYYKYQLSVTSRDPDGFEKLKELAKLPGVFQAEICDSLGGFVEAGGVFRPTWEGEELPFQDKDSFRAGIWVLDEEGFQAYCRQVGLSYEAARNKAIVNVEGAGWKRGAGTYGNFVQTGEPTADFQAGDMVSGNFYMWQLGQYEPVSMEVACQTQELPLSVIQAPAEYVLFFVSESWAKQQDIIMLGGASLYLLCEDANAVEDAIVDSDLVAYSLNNCAEKYAYQKNILIVAAVFLAGFIGVLILIGITNLLNALITSMELRAPEFARLRAMGMTGKEFRSMIWLEGFFYGGKALLFGLPLGIGVSYGLYWTILPLLDRQMNTVQRELTIPYAYHLPVPELLLSVVAVAILLHVSMRYCMKKIGRRNVIETIRNENI